MGYRKFLPDGMQIYFCKMAKLSRKPANARNDKRSGIKVIALFCRDGATFLERSGSNRRHRGGKPMRLSAGAGALCQHLLVRAIADNSKLPCHAAVHVVPRNRRLTLRNYTRLGLGYCVLRGC